MAKQVVLSKESSESEIKRYFNAVLSCRKLTTSFPSILMKCGRLCMAENLTQWKRYRKTL